jgi:16S rRNA C967 or C1407 C5-methylase (RsmB/RsmF family)
MSIATTLQSIDLTPLERYRPIVDDWDAFADALRRPLPTCIWANPLRTTPNALVDGLRNHGLNPTPLLWLDHAFRLPADVDIGRQFAYVTGLLHVQEEVSLLPVPLLDPQPGERVLDLCAAPGNKTAQIATRMLNRGTVVANDINYGRVASMRSTLDRLGIANVSATTYDAANYPPESGTFDRVLADVPCSCEGTPRKQPSVIAQRGAMRGAMRDPTGAQRAILRQAVRRCRPSGCIVYATCTYAPEENEAIIDAVLRDVGPDALQLRPARPGGFIGSPGLTEWQGQSFHPSLANALRIWPHQNDTGGFFVAVLEKTDA